MVWPGNISLLYKDETFRGCEDWGVRTTFQPTCRLCRLTRLPVLLFLTVSPHLTSLSEPHTGTGCTGCLSQHSPMSSQPKSAHSARNQLARTQHSCRKGQFSSVAPQSTVHRVNTKYCLSVVWWGVVVNITMIIIITRTTLTTDMTSINISTSQQLNIVFQAGLDQRPARWWRWLDWLSEEREDCTSLPCTSSACSNCSTLNPPACRIYFSLQTWASPGLALIVTKYYSNLPQGTMKWSYWDS